MPTRRPHDYAVWWVLLMALAVRLSLFAVAWPSAGRFMAESDATEYWRLGRNLAAGHGLSQASQPPYTPDVRRTPIYPLSIAAVLLVRGAGVRTVVLVGILMSVATVFALMRLTAMLYGRPAGRVAGFLLAIDLTSAAYANQVMTETLFTLLLVASFVVLSERAVADRWAGIAGGLLAGLAALCRPIGLFVSAALWPICHWRAPGARSRAASMFLTAVAASACLVVVWIARNERVAGVATISSLGATNTYFHRAAYVEAYREGRRVEDVRDRWEHEFAERGALWTEAERVDWLAQHGRALVLAHPFDYTVVWIAGIARMLRPDHDALPHLIGLQSNTVSGWIVSAVGWAQVLLVYVAAFYGSIAAVRRSRAAAAVPLGLIAYFVIVGGPEMYPRFRVPLMPAVCMLAAVGVQHAGQGWRRTSRGRRA